MKAGVIMTGSGPILILTSYASFSDAQFLDKLATKGIEKFIAYELPLELVQEKYGTHYSVVMHDVRQSDDLRVLDYDGHRVFKQFHFSELGAPQYFENKTHAETAPSIM